MTNPTRQLAQSLRDSPVGASPSDCHAAAAAIDALLDAIEASGMVQPRQAPQMDLGPLRAVRAWHGLQADNQRALGNFSAERFHNDVAKKLNVYFPQDEQL